MTLLPRSLAEGEAGIVESLNGRVAGQVFPETLQPGKQRAEADHGSGVHRKAS